MKEQSVIGSFYTMSACLSKISGINPNHLQPQNPNQKQFIEIFKNTYGAEIPEIQAVVSFDNPTPVNTFLKQHGFDIQSEQGAQGSLYLASILELALKWKEKGKKATIYHNKEIYKGIHLLSDVSVVKADGFALPVAIIETDNGDKVYMTIPATPPTDSFEVFELARKLLRAKTIIEDEVYEQEVIFPKIDLDIQPNVDWLLGLSNRAGAWEIQQAMQQTKVNMDESGVVVKEAFSMVACLASFNSEPEPLYIDKPFLFVIERKGLKEPLFSAYLNLDGWLKDKYP